VYFFPTKKYINIVKRPITLNLCNNKISFTDAHITGEEDIIDIGISYIDL
jgi:hypothetical protein